MGKFVNGVLGTCTGKVGGIVGRTWKGINTVASYQPNVSNPRSNAQIGQRTKMTGLTQLASVINSSFIKPMWDRDAKKMSGFNSFIQANMAAISTAGVLDFSKIVASKGKMAAPVVIDVNLTDTNINFVYNTAILDAYGLPSDLVYAFAIDENTGDVFTQSEVVARGIGMGKVTMPLAHPFEGYVYLAFRRADGSITSIAAVEHYTGI